MNVPEMVGPSMNMFVQNFRLSVSKIFHEIHHATWYLHQRRLIYGPRMASAGAQAHLLVANQALVKTADTRRSCEAWDVSTIDRAATGGDEKFGQKFVRVPAKAKINRRLHPLHEDPMHTSDTLPARLQGGLGAGSN